MKVYSDFAIPAFGRHVTVYCRELVSVIIETKHNWKPVQYEVGYRDY
jgi:hypothetical protein